MAQKRRDALESDKYTGKRGSSRTLEMIEKVRDFVENDFCASLRMIAEALVINKDTIRTMNEDLAKTMIRLNLFHTL